jgi:hypothetical protein
MLACAGYRIGEGAGRAKQPGLVLAIDLGVCPEFGRVRMEELAILYIRCTTK